jgi:hypothetical protein
MVFCRLFNPMSGCRLPNRGRLWSPHWSCGKSGLSHVSATWGRFEEMGLYMGWYENRAPRIPIVSVCVFSQFKNVILGVYPIFRHTLYIYIYWYVYYIYICLYYSLVMLNNYVFLHIYFSVCCIPGPSWTLKLPEAISKKLQPIEPTSTAHDIIVRANFKNVYPLLFGETPKWLHYWQAEKYLLSSLGFCHIVLRGLILACTADDSPWINLAPLQLTYTLPNIGDAGRLLSSKHVW